MTLESGHQRGRPSLGVQLGLIRRVRDHHATGDEDATHCQPSTCAEASPSPTATIASTYGRGDATCGLRWKCKPSKRSVGYAGASRIAPAAARQRSHLIKVVDELSNSHILVDSYSSPDIYINITLIMDYNRCA